MTALVWYIPWIQIYWLKLSRKKNKLISDVEVVKVVVNPLCACYRFAHGVISMNCSEQLVHIPNHSASTPHRLSESIAYVIHVLLVGISQNDRLSIHTCAHLLCMQNLHVKTKILFSAFIAIWINLRCCIRHNLKEEKSISIHRCSGNTNVTPINYSAVNVLNVM